MQNAASRQVNAEGLRSPVVFPWEISSPPRFSFSSMPVSVELAV
jgi:hypothetical protein